MSTLDGIRSKNIADTAAYVRQVETIGHALAESEPLDAEALRIERIAMGLRTLEGIPLDLLDAAARTTANAFASEGLAVIEGERLILAGRGRALVDAIAAELV